MPELVIEHVEARRIEGSMWGGFWDAQRTAASMSPMAGYAAYAGSLESWWWPQAQILVRVVATGGASGLGWAEDGTGGATAVIESHLKHLLLGQPAFAIERLWDQMYRASIPYGRGGIALHAISAVDIALWDLKGRALGQPIHALLGGKRNDSLPAYASHLQPRTPDLIQEEVRGYLAEGFRSMKMRMPGGPAMGETGLRTNAAHVAVVREAAGDEVELMADAYMGWDLRFARSMMPIMAAHGLRWIEEPLLPDEVDAYAALAQGAPVAVAHGENVFTPWSFHDLARRGAAQVLQPDVHRVGGITGFKRVAQIAEVHGLEIAPHAFSAPTVHVCATVGGVRVLEKLTIPCWARTGDASPPLILGEPELVGGRVTIPDAPGHGATLNRDVAPDLAHWA